MLYMVYYYVYSATRQYFQKKVSNRTKKYRSILYWKNQFLVALSRKFLNIFLTKDLQKNPSIYIALHYSQNYIVAVRVPDEQRLLFDTFIF